jgi:AcrR family transcriptional regulator
MDLRYRKGGKGDVAPTSKVGAMLERDPKPHDNSTTPSPRAGRPRSQTTRKAIMRAVLSMLKREDYADISIERIASTAKVSKHSIYRWWNSKGDIVLDAFFEYALTRAAKVAHSDNVFADLENFVIAAYQSWRDPLYEKGLRGLVIEMAFDASLRRKFNEAYLTPRKKIIGNILQHGIDRGQLRADTDIETVVDVVCGFVWFHISFNATGQDERRAAQNLVAMLCPWIARGLK